MAIPSKPPLASVKTISAFVSLTSLTTSHNDNGVWLSKGSLLFWLYRGIDKECVFVIIIFFLHEQLSCGYLLELLVNESLLSTHTHTHTHTHTRTHARTHARTHTHTHTHAHHCYGEISK